MLDCNGLKLLLALVVTGLMLILMIAGAASPWYLIERPPVAILEFLSYVDLSGAGPDDTSCMYVESDCVGTNMRAMYGVIVAIVTVDITLGGVVFGCLCWSFCSTAGCCRRQLITNDSQKHHQQAKPRRNLRIPLLIISFIVFILSIAAWTVYFWHPHALHHDFYPSTHCSGAPNTPECDFMGTSFGPHAGWGMYISSSFFSLLAFVAVLVVGSPSTKKSTTTTTTMSMAGGGLNASNGSGNGNGMANHNNGDYRSLSTGSTGSMGSVMSGSERTQLRAGVYTRIEEGS